MAKDEEVSLRDSITAAMDSEGSPTAQPDAVPDSIIPEKTDKFADDGSHEESAAANAAPVAEKAPDSEGAKPVATPAAVKPPKMPPGFPDVNVWNGLDAKAKQWVKDRESQFGQGLQKNAQFAQLGSQIAETLRPYEWMLQSKGVPPAAAVRDAMQFTAVMTTGTPQEKAMLIAKATQHYGVDPRQLAAVLGGAQAQQPQANPEVQQLKQQLAALTNHLQGGAVAQAQHEARQAWSAVEQMANDSKYEHLDVVANDMADLVQLGKASSLDDAYQKAMWMRPDTRALLTSQEAAKRAEAARAAAGESTAHGGSAVAGSTKPQNRSLRATITDAWDRSAA